MTDYNWIEFESITGLCFVHTLHAAHKHIPDHDFEKCLP